MARPPKDKKINALSKKLGVQIRKLRHFGLDRDVSPLVRKMLINQIKRSLERRVRANG
jgi:hypothetical protein